MCTWVDCDIIVSVVIPQCSLVPLELVLASVMSIPSEPAAGAGCMFAFAAGDSSVMSVSSWVGFLQATKRQFVFWMPCANSQS